jgi:hypothetical protein
MTLQQEQEAARALADVLPVDTKFLVKRMTDEYGEPVWQTVWQSAPDTVTTVIHRDPVKSLQAAVSSSMEAYYGIRNR